MYLVVTEAVVSSVICSLRNDKMMPVYYVSHVLVEAETRYNPLEKHIFNLVMSAYKLKPYFRGPIVILASVPLQQVMHKYNLTGRMTKWDLELSKYQIDFQSRRSLQAQVLADFVVENTLMIVVEPTTSS